MRVRPNKHLLAAVATAMVLASVAACGDSKGSSGAKSDVDVDAASAYLEHYKKVGDFPITEPLAKAPSSGSSVVFLKASTSVTALQDASLRAAAETMGMKYSSIDVGTSAETTNAALDSVVAMKPDAVVNVAIDPTLFSGQLKELRDAGTTVVSAAIVNGDKFGFDTVLADSADVVETGKIMAAQALAAGNGDVTELVYYKTPELQFTTEMERGVEEGVKEFCVGCDLRVVNIPIAEVGTKAPDRIVSDLQAHPGTKAAIASFDEIFLGLPAALDVAGLDIYTIGQAPVEATYEAIKNGKQNATVAWDVDMMMWSVLDQVARELGGQDVPKYEQDGLLIKQVITADNIPDDTKRGWSAYSDFADKFAALWSVK